MKASSASPSCSRLTSSSSSSAQYAVGASVGAAVSPASVGAGVACSEGAAVLGSCSTSTSPVANPTARRASVTSASMTSAAEGPAI